MPLTDRSYFFGNLFIARAGAELDKLITVLEPEWLERTLGYSFAKAFADGLEEEDIAARWLQLRDGVAYEDGNGKTHHWHGFANGQKQSPIAAYIYCRYAEQNASITTEKGEMAETAGGYAATSGAYKQLRAWNGMVAQIGYTDRQGVLQAGNLYHYLLMATDDNGALLYPEFSLADAQPFSPKNLLNI